MKLTLRNLKRDLPASIVVFFVALPLCLGIALASGAPLFSGIISGIVGGIVVGFASKSEIGVSGPAAGLAVIVYTYIATLNNSYPAFLNAVIIAGFIQIIAGYLKMGSIAYYLPSSVIKGMLSGIGIIIILKQIPHAIGYDSDFEGDMAFEQQDGYNTISEITHAYELLTPEVILISLISMLILIFWDRLLNRKHRIFRFLQGPLMAVLIGIIITSLAKSGVLPFYLEDKHLVNIPTSSNLSEFLTQFTLPDFSYLRDPQIYLMGLILAVVASVETLLCVEATDKIDPYRRITPTNRELKAQGLGNVISGFIGGLPLTQVVVRSSANASFGAKTKTSAILHGFFLLFTAIAIPDILNMIPLASLSCILIIVGYKLATPKIFKETFKLGLEQFLPFITTIIVMVLTDLLKGVAAGLLVAIIFVLHKGLQNSYQLMVEKGVSGSQYLVRLAEEVSFLNKGSILKLLNSIPRRSRVIIDGAHSEYIHHDVVEIIDNFQINSKTKGISLEVRGKEINKRKEISAISQRDLKELTPKKAIQLLKDGNKRFVNNLHINRNLLRQVNDTSKEQNPFAFVLSCIDSRTSAELIFDQGLGDILSCRIAGNILNDDILGSMEFGSKVIGVKLIVVLGHSGCGAIKGACEHVEMGNLTGLLEKIKPAIAMEGKNHDRNFVENVATNNVKLIIKDITKRSPIIKELIGQQKIAIIGGMYDVATGKVEFYD